MARVSRVTLFEREIRERISEPALELLLHHAEILTEGECASGGSDPDGPFFGSTMFTIDLAALRGAVRERCDDASARRLSRLIETDARVQERVRQIAQREATRLLARRVRAADAVVRVRAQGTVVYIDVDIEGDLYAAPRRAFDS